MVITSFFAFDVAIYPNQSQIISITPRFATNKNPTSIKDDADINFKLESVRLFLENPKWNLITENPHYKIYHRGGSIFTIVIDKKFNIPLAIDSSCEMEISDDDKNNKENFFYNSTVGIKETGPYKVIKYDLQTDEFVQTVSSAGCTYEEGRIKLITDEKREKVQCEIKTKSVLIGC